MKNWKLTLGIITGSVLMTVFLLYRRKSITSFKKRLVNNANREWKLWGSQLRSGGKSIQSGSKECSDIYRERVGEYWGKGVNRNYDGCSNVPWSSAFISFVMKKSGSGDDFPYASAHNRYIRHFISQRGTNSAFEGYRLTEKPLQKGDLICYSRQSGVNYSSTHSYKGHCDIVVDVNKLFGNAEVIGGNVSDGVTKKVVDIDSKGYLIDKDNDWFTIIKTNK